MSCALENLELLAEDTDTLPEILAAAVRQLSKMEAENVALEQERKKWKCRAEDAEEELEDIRQDALDRPI